MPDSSQPSAPSSATTGRSPGTADKQAGRLARASRIGLWLALAYCVLGFLLTAANIPPANQEARQAATWLLFAGAVWVVLRLLLFAWSVLQLVRTCEWDGRLQKAEWYMAGLTMTVVAPAVTIGLVVLWWPWRKGMVLAAGAAFLLGFSLGYFVEVWYLYPWPRRLAARLLARRLPRFRELLRSSDTRERVKAAQAMVRMAGYGASAVPDLIEALQDVSAEVRSQAALAIYFNHRSIPTNDLHLSTALRPLLRDPDARVRIVAAGTLVDLGATAALEVLPALAEGLLHSDDQFAESIAAGALGQLGPDAAPTIPALRAALFDRHPPNVGALGVLAKIGEPGVAVLAEALTHPEASVREWAAFYLGEMGQVAVAALPALQVAQSDKAERVRRAAATGLQRIADN